MFNVTMGEYLHKEILFHNARHFGTNGLGTFSKPPENYPMSPDLKGCFNKEVGSYCQHCQEVGHHTRECPIPTRPPPTLPSNYKSQTCLGSQTSKVIHLCVGELQSRWQVLGA